MPPSFGTLTRVQKLALLGVVTFMGLGVLLKRAAIWAWKSGFCVAAPLLLVSLAYIHLWFGPSVNETDELGDSSLYLLSAAAQALATVLGLVFTVSLVALQVMYRYSSRSAGEAFDRVTISYVTLFGAGTLGSLMFLLEPTIYRIRLVLTIVAMCLSFLIPYGVRLRRLLNPLRAVSDLSQEAISQARGLSLARKRLSFHRADLAERSLQESLERLIEFGLSSIALGDYPTATYSIKAVGDVASEAGRVDPPPFSVVRLAVEYLEDVATRVMADPRIPFSTIEAFKRSAHGNSGLVILSLERIGIRAVEEHHDLLAIECVRAIKEAATRGNAVGREARAISAVDGVATAAVEQNRSAVVRAIREFEGGA